MDDNLRKSWTEIIISEELDDHLDDLGQAKINALLVEKMISEFKLPPCSKILMPGCGTGQIFDYLSIELMNNYKLTFTDINQSFLDKLTERLRLTHSSIEYMKCQIDDLENTTLREFFNGIIIVLVLEQLEWKVALQTLINYRPEYIYLVIQEQSFNAETITVNVKSRDSIRLFSEIAKPQLIPKDELITLLEAHNYEVSKVYEEEVPNNKKMVGLVFRNEINK